MNLEQVRLAALVLAVLATGWALVRWRAVLRGLRVYLFEPSYPARIALVRIALFGGLAYVGARTRAVWWAAQPEGLRAMPPGWGVLESALPIDAASAQLAQWLVISSSLCAMLGLLTRVTAPVSALAAVFLLGIPSFFGKVLHMDHGLVMMVLVLAAAPCGDALSIDRWLATRRGRPRPGPSGIYTLPLRLCWLLLGTVYLFPGLWKVYDNGDLWLNGQRLLWELYDEWGHRTYLRPPARIDTYPWLLKLLGTATLVFEVGFFFAVFSRRGRVLAALSAAAFHAGVRLFLGIKFYALLPLVVLFDSPLTDGLVRRLSTAAKGPLAGVGLPRALPAALVGGVLLLGQFAVGTVRIDTWPIAIHPIFGERRGPGRRVGAHEILLESAGAPTRNVVEHLSKRGAGHGFVRIMRRFDRDVRRRIPRQRTGRQIVAMLRDNDLALHSGDALALYRTTWNIFPLQQRTGQRRRLIRRYRVTQDAGLSALARRADRSP